MTNLSKPFVEYQEKGAYGTKTRDPSAKELAAAEAIKSEVEAAEAALTAARAHLEKTLKKCKHVVSQDAAGFPYDVRRCYACGAHLGLI